MENTTDHTSDLLITTGHFILNETINKENLGMIISSSFEDDMSTSPVELNSTTPGYLNTTGEPAPAVRNELLGGFLMFVLSIFLPGMFAHVVALYCLLQDVGKKMMLAKRLLLCLCFVDMLGLCSILVYQYIVVFVKYPPRALCAVNSFFVCFLPLMSGGLTTYMAVERCVKFCAPFWHATNATTWKMKLPIAIATSVFATVALFPVSGLGYILSEDGSKCLTFPTTVPRLYNSPGGIFTIVYAIVGLSTVTIDVTANCITIVTLATIRTRRMDIGNVADVKEAEMAMAWMLFWLSSVFLLTLSPLYLSLVTLYAGFPMNRIFKIFTHFLAGLNFTLDPFIYISTMKTYRYRAVSLLTCFRKSDSACATEGPFVLTNSNKSSSSSTNLS